MKETKKLLLIFILVFISITIKPAIASNSTNSNKKGLALTGSQTSDVDLLGAAWWYVYAVWDDHLTDPRYVLLLYDGLPDPSLPASWPGHILVFNEPSINDITPLEGAVRYLVLREHYPHAQLVIGGIVESHLNWAREFLQYVPKGDEPDSWHVHHYFADSIDQAMLDIRLFHEFVGKPIWITEFGSVISSVPATQGFLVWIESCPWIERYAYFPTRMNKAYYWFPQTWSDDMALIDCHLSDLKPLGELYKNFEIFQVFFPYVR